MFNITNNQRKRNRKIKWRKNCQEEWYKEDCTTKIQKWNWTRNLVCMSTKKRDWMDSKYHCSNKESTWSQIRLWTGRSTQLKISNLKNIMRQSKINCRASRTITMNQQLIRLLLHIKKTSRRIIIYKTKRTSRAWIITNIY